MASLPASLTGKLLLHYRVGHRLGGGGMGEVYLAEDTRLGRQVALKFLAPSGQRDAESRARLVREARSASLLRSPNIAVTYDLVEHEDSLFIAMEYVEGDLIADRVSRGPLPLREAADIASQVADALDEAHSHGIIHRDIKSANIIQTRRGLVKVLDFGLAKFDDASGATRIGTRTDFQVTTPGVVMGTVGYMAPEQLLGGAIDHRIDIFSLGVVLYEMVTGRLPFAGESLAEISDRILRHEPDAIARFNYAAPPELDAIVRKALQKNPALRYQSAREFHIDLHHLSRRLESNESTSTLPVRVEAAPAPSGLSAPVAAGERLIAVLTFANVTRESIDDWIGTGIAETVTTDLKNVPGLSVIGRAQIFELLKSMPTSADHADDHLAIELGRRLGAWWVVSGAYQRLGPRIRITAHVIEVLTGSLIKTVKIDGAIDDIFELQDRIVFELSRSLDVKIDKAGADAIAKDETTSVEAFEAYSRGVLNMRTAGRDAMDRAIALFERALELDPDYAAAWAALGGALSLKGVFLSLPQLNHKAIDALTRAIALDTRETRARVWLAQSLSQVGRLHEAMWQLQEAVRTEPGNADAIAALARAYWMYAGDVASGIRELRRALAINPEGGNAWLQLSLLEALSGDLASAELSARQAIELQVRAMSGTEGLLIIGAHARLGYVYYLRGDYDAAYLEYRRELEFLNATQHSLRERTIIELHHKLSAVHQARGEADEARRFGDLAIDQLEGRIAAGADDPSTRYYGAAAYALRGDVENTRRHLQLPLERIERFTRWRIERDPDFRLVRDALAST